MDYQIPEIADASKKLKDQLNKLEDKSAVLKSPELKSLLDRLKQLPPEERSKFGAELNALKQELAEASASQSEAKDKGPIDLSAPFDINATEPKYLSQELGSIHPLNQELSNVLDIFYRMGFNAYESREIDDDYHMFSSLNFPEGHPARDDYDTFLTNQVDPNKQPFIAPAHTSTMQNRVLKELKPNLENGDPIACVIAGRVFRNEDLDPRHEHTFYQLEGVYVDEGVNTGHLIATLKTFLQSYYGKELKVQTQPFYFPFTEPSFEFSLSCPFCDQKGCNVCSQTGWIELLGCGMIHPNVLREAGIDTDKYSGFAWGGGIERLVMMKYSIEDIRYFESGRLEFLRQFK
ncbi:MAG TPA: phenylalanine--tRNA ligase subunit alpha [Candidatus Sulfotelmatobacter sp.]|nr:phenylalanine--tRNA ligase subunit alpha [Candidatus Sulfotelmatobacter sp.]